MREKIISTIVATVITTILVCNFFSIEKEQISSSYNHSRLMALEKLTSASDEIQSDFNRSLHYADFFDIIISKNPEIEKDTIYDYAKLIMKQNKNIVSVQLAPEGIVSMIYPLEGNEAAIGHNLLTDNERKKYAQEAIEERIAVTQGPVKAKQGGYLIFNRKAIFIAENREEIFWGFSIIAVSFSELIKKYEEKLEGDNYLFAIRANVGDSEEEFLWGDYDIFNKDSAVKTVVLPYNEWDIAIYPVNGWEKERASFKGLNIFFSIVAILAFLLIYYCVRFYLEKIEESKKELLTGTLNKNSLKIFAERKFLKKNRKHGIIVMDLNSFKDINDHFGHPVGDCVLIEVSKRTNEVIGKSDRLSRFGGDEYLVFINDIKSEEAVKQLVDRIIKNVATPMLINGLSFKICISAGYTIYPDDGETFDELYKAADKKMYDNKEENRLVCKSRCLNKDFKN